MIVIRTASVPLGLEDRPERAVNGAPCGSSAAAPTRARALAIEAAGRRAVLISADTIWFGTALADSLRAEVAGRAGCDPARVSVCATHTHGTPNPEPAFAYGESSAALVDHIRARVLEAADAALAAPADEVSIAVGRAPAPAIAISRRRAAWTRRGMVPMRRVQNLPNNARPVDERVTVVSFRTEDGRTPALIVHFACHPVADPADRRGADFPGALCDALEARLGAGTCCAFLQGFCGDVRPDLRYIPCGAKDLLVETIIGPRFRPSRPGDAEKIAARLADAALEAMRGARPVEVRQPAFARERIALADIDGAPTGRELDVTTWRLADGLRLVFAGGEMLSGLAPADDATLAVGYANGMAGYIAPAADYAGGGYEIDGFLARFGLARRFSPDTARAFRAAAQAG